jgi:hypothetical protein
MMFSYEIGYLRGRSSMQAAMTMFDQAYCSCETARKENDADTDDDTDTK